MALARDFDLQAPAVNEGLCTFSGLVNTALTILCNHGQVGYCAIRSGASQINCRFSS